MSEVEKPKISLPIIVEGKYDKITLSSIVDADIFTTGGFSVFNSAETRALLVRICSPRGAILLTDPDGGGTQIRSFLKSILPPEHLHCVYLPKIPGKEKRKKTASKSGLLGVEGMDRDTLLHALSPFFGDGAGVGTGGITKTDFYLDGLTGGENAQLARDTFARKLSLPVGMSAGALLCAANLLLSKEEYTRLLHGEDKEE